MTDQTQSISQQASVAPEAAVTRRNLSMAFFATEKDHAEVAYTKTIKPLGQIVGQIFEIGRRMGKLPSGEAKESVFAIGEFEAVNYKTGEVIETGVAYLPGYFLQAAESRLTATKLAGGHAIEFAIEVELQPTGKSIPTTYMVRNLVARAASSRIDALKRQLQEAGRLRLSAPTDLASLPAPEGELIEGELVSRETGELVAGELDTGEPEAPETPSEAMNDAPAPRGRRPAGNAAQTA